MGQLTDFESDFEDSLRAIDQRIDNLEEHIERINRRLDHQTPQPVMTSTSRCIVTEAQVQRWERIEKAAEELRSLLGKLSSNSFGGEAGYQAWFRLNGALKS